MLVVFVKRAFYLNNDSWHFTSQKFFQNRLFTPVGNLNSELQFGIARLQNKVDIEHTTVHKRPLSAEKVLNGGRRGKIELEPRDLLEKQKVIYCCIQLFSP